jgi:hypothetical protein
MALRGSLAASTGSAQYKEHVSGAGDTPEYPIALQMPGHQNKVKHNLLSLTAKTYLHARQDDQQLHCEMRQLKSHAAYKNIHRSAHMHAYNNTATEHGHGLKSKQQCCMEAGAFLMKQHQSCPDEK